MMARRTKTHRQIKTQQSQHAFNGFAPYKNKHENEPAYLVGSGPTVLSFSAEKLPSGVYIGINDAYLAPTVNINYVMTEKQRPELEDLPPETTIFHCDEIKLNRPNCFTYRHYLAELGPALQGTFQELITRFGGTSSMSYHAFFLTLYLGCNPIHLVGCDCTSHRFYETGQVDYYDKLIKGWTYIKTYMTQNHPDVEIININPKGLKDMFRSVYLEESVN